MPRHLPVNARSDRTGKAVRVDGHTSRRTSREDKRPAKVDPVPSRTLSTADAAFLYLERKEMPLAIACVMIFDGPIPFDDFVASMASKLHRVPRYQQVVVMPPLNIDLPTWEDDPHFDIRRHIFRVVVDPPGGQAELEALAGRIFSRMLDRSKPLWEVYVVDGLKDGRGALIWRLHHALADGISGTRLLEVLLDPTPEGSPAFSKPRPRLPQPSNGAPAGGNSGLVHTTLDRLISGRKRTAGFRSGPSRRPEAGGVERPFEVTAGTAGVRGEASVQQAVRGRSEVLLGGV